MERTLITTSGLSFKVTCVHMAHRYEGGPTAACSYGSNHKICCGLKFHINLNFSKPRVRPHGPQPQDNLKV